MFVLFIHHIIHHGGLGPARLLEAGADRGDAVGVEAEPVHPPDVAGVLELDAAVHDHRQAALLRDPRALGADHAELAPQGAGADRHCLPGDAGDRARRPEDVHHVDMLGNVEQARVAPFAENLGLARVHRDHPVAVPLEVVADEVACAQLIARQAHDRDRLRGVQHPLDRHHVLVAPEVELRVHIGHDVTAFFPAVAATRLKPCSRSQIRSSTDSAATATRTLPAPTPAARSSSSLSWRWVVLAGWMIRLLASPTLARWDQSDTPRIRSCPPARPPAQSNENTAPALSGRYFSTSGRYLLDGRLA